MAFILHYMGAGVEIEKLDVGQCTVRRCHGDEGSTHSWWNLWLRVLRVDGTPETFCVPINVGGDFQENTPHGRAWGFKLHGPGTHGWDVSPSINVTETKQLHPGEHPTEVSLWHETPSIVNVPDGEPWMPITFPLKCRYVILNKVEEPCTEEDCKEKPHTRQEWRFSLPDGTPIEWAQIGDLYFNNAHEPTPEGAKAYGCYWDNCDGKHLHCVLPDGHHWNVDSRASNCTKKDDRTHRCWVRTGSPQDGTITAGKSGPGITTCDAGAGSIQTDKFHGFLRDGHITL